jgi:hypothetical protein
MDEIIANILLELDNEYSSYQKTFRKYYGKDDLQAKHTYELMKKLCLRIRKEVENKNA